MNQSAAEIRSLTKQDIHQSRVPLGPQQLADVLRQSSGVHLVGIGTDVHHVASEIENKKNEGQKLVQSEESILEISKVWIGEANIANLPRIENISPESIGHTFGCIELTKQVTSVINDWIQQEPTGRRRTLASLFQEDPLDSRSFAYKIIETQQKIHTLRKEGIVSDDSELGKTLVSMSSFIEKDVLPMLQLEEHAYVSISKNIEEKLHEKNSKRGSYVNRAARLFYQHSRLEDDKKSSSIESMYHSFARIDVLKVFPAIIQEELFTIATQINQVRLLEFIESKNIDLIEMKQKISEILRKSVSQNEKPGELSSGYAMWLKELLPYIATISNLIQKEFPHDTAYLLGHTLEHHQATCSGKTHMLTFVLRSLGLDALNTKVAVRGFSEFKSQHIETSVQLPHNICLTLDTNWAIRPSIIEGIRFNHVAAINIPTGNTLSDFEIAKRNAKKDRFTYVLDVKGLHEYTYQGFQHPILSFHRNSDTVDYLNISIEYNRIMKKKSELATPESVLSVAYWLEKNAEINPYDTESADEYVNFLNAYAQVFVDQKYRDFKMRTDVYEYAFDYGLDKLKFNPMNINLRASIIRAGNSFRYKSIDDEQDRLSHMYDQYNYILSHKEYLNEVDFTEDEVKTAFANFLHLYSGVLDNRFGNRIDLLFQSQRLLQEVLAGRNPERHAYIDYASLLSSNLEIFIGQFSSEDEMIEIILNNYKRGYSDQKNRYRRYQYAEFLSNYKEPCIKYLNDNPKEIHSAILRNYQIATRDNPDSYYKYALFVINNIREIHDQFGKHAGRIIQRAKRFLSVYENTIGDASESFVSKSVLNDMRSTLDMYIEKENN